MANKVYTGVCQACDTLHSWTSGFFQYPYRGAPQTSAQKGQRVFERFTSAAVHLGFYKSLPGSPLTRAGAVGGLCIAHALMRPYKPAARDHLWRIGDIIGLGCAVKGSKEIITRRAFISLGHLAKAMGCFLPLTVWVWKTNPFAEKA